MASEPRPILDGECLRRSPIVLVGYRGTGKTTIGRAISERLAASGVDAPCVDTDRLVERAAGASIAELFAGEGESGFRDREARALAEALAGGGVIATGGGIVVREPNRIRLHDDRLHVVWLTASVDTIDSRLQSDPATASTRPALTERSARSEIEMKLAERHDLYSEVADVRVDTDRLPVERCATAIIQQYRLKMFETAERDR